MADLSTEGVKEFQAKLKEAILTADVAIYGTQQQLPTLLNQLDSALENILTFGVLTETKANVRRAYDESIANWEMHKKSLWAIVGTGTIEGRPITEQSAQAAFGVITGDIKSAQAAISNVTQYTRGRLLTGAALQTFTKMSEVLSKALDAVLSILRGIAKAGEGAGTAIGWLPWIIGGAIILPFVLRTFSAYKKGGATAAAEEAAGQIERGRSAAGSAIASGARKLATRGMAGAPRRRRSMRSR